MVFCQCEQIAHLAETEFSLHSQDQRFFNIFSTFLDFLTMLLLAHEPWIWVKLPFQELKWVFAKLGFNVNFIFFDDFGHFTIISVVFILIFWQIVIVISNKIVLYVHLSEGLKNFKATEPVSLRFKPESVLGAFHDSAHKLSQFLASSSVWWTRER